MSLLEDLRRKEESTQKQHVIMVRQQLQAAGLLKYTECTSCKSQAVVLTHVVADPKKRDAMYQLVTLENMISDDPIALVCADCGLVMGTMVRNRLKFEKGARIQGLKDFE